MNMNQLKFLMDANVVIEVDHRICLEFADDRTGEGGQSVEQPLNLQLHSASSFCFLDYVTFHHEDGSTVFV
jgi:hypothetical protein